MDSTVFSKHPEWPTVLFIVETLKSHGHQAVLAGGCVRDALLGKTASDLDVATDATPDQIESYFPRVLPLGKSFGVCRVIQDGMSIEVATFRQEFDYRDGRRPSKVEFSSLEKDAERRDFTINALFYDVSAGKVVDLVDGLTDLKNKWIRAVGDPNRRLNEDYLRILRGVRFAGQLDFKIETNTYSALKNLAQYLPRISRERIYDELNKMFVPYGMSRCFELLSELKILEFVFQDWELGQELVTPSGCISLSEAFLRLSRVESLSPLFGWVALYHLRSQQVEPRPLDKEFLDMKLPRATIDTCRSILDAQGILQKTDDDALTAFITMATSGVSADAILYWDALFLNNSFTRKVAEFEKLYFVNGALPEPIVTGHDLIKYGLPQGPGMKLQLQSLYLQQLKKPSLTKTELLGLVGAVGTRGLT